MKLSPAIAKIALQLVERPASFQKGGRKSYEGTYETKSQDYKVVVWYSADGARAELIFEQRPGVWFRLGDFPDTLQYKSALQFFNISRASAMTTYNFNTAEEVQEWLAVVLK